MAISDVCANGNQTHVVLNSFLMCGEHLSRIMLYGIAATALLFVKLNMENRGGLTVILSSLCATLSTL